MGGKKVLQLLALRVTTFKSENATSLENIMICNCRHCIIIFFWFRVCRFATIEVVCINSERKQRNN